MAFTSDEWTSHAQLSYLSLKIHFVNRPIELHKLIVVCCSTEGEKDDMGIACPSCSRTSSIHNKMHVELICILPLLIIIYMLCDMKLQSYSIIFILWMHFNFMTNFQKVHQDDLDWRLQLHEQGHFWEKILSLPYLFFGGNNQQSLGWGLPKATVGTCHLEDHGCFCWNTVLSLTL